MFIKITIKSKWALESWHPSWTSLLSLTTLWLGHLTTACLPNKWYSSIYSPRRHAARLNEGEAAAAPCKVAEEERRGAGPSHNSVFPNTWGFLGSVPTASPSLRDHSKRRCGCRQHFAHQQVLLQVLGDPHDVSLKARCKDCQCPWGSLRKSATSPAPSRPAPCSNHS